jgi:hypothetical protein
MSDLSENSDTSSDAQRELDDEFVQHVKKLSEKGERMKEEGDQLGLGVPDEQDVQMEDALSESVLEETQNPDEAHDLYYSIQQLLQSSLPQGQQFDDLRDAVYEEKNIYLTGGEKKDEQGIRGADSRQGYLHHLRVMLRIVKEWSRRDASPFDLWSVLRKINEDLDYHDTDYFSDREAEEKVESLFSQAIEYHRAAE